MSGHRIGFGASLPLPLLLVLGLFAGCADSGAPTAAGKAGSLARFAVYGDCLYTVSDHNVAVFDIQEKYAPERIGSFNAEETLETVFLSGKHLYLGTQEGMLIYSLDNPRSPRPAGRHAHVVSCDPVVVQDDIAYVTLRAESRCRRGANELQVLDVSKPETPRLLARHPLSNPGGLGVDGRRLYVLDGNEGVKIFDVSDPQDLKPLGGYPLLTGYDVIPYGKLLIVIAAEGLFFFDSSRLPLAKLSQVNIWR